MTTKTQKFNSMNLKQLPNIHPGDSVRVHQKIKEGDPSAGSGQVKERIQVFEGIIIAAKHGKGISGTITVRKVVEGVGVERIFPIHSPSLSKIEVVGSGKVRRSKLYYLRHVKGKKSRLKKKDMAMAAAVIKEEPEAVEEATQETAKEK